MARVAPLVVRVLAALVVVWAFMVGVGLLLTKVIEHSALLHREDEVNESLAHHRDHLMNDVTYVLSGLGNTGAIIGALLVVAIAMRIVLKRWREPIYLVVAVAGQALVFFCAQLVITRPRPHVHKLDKSPPTSSFPSGHTGAATALFVASALLVAWYVRRRLLRIIAVATLAVVPLLVAYGRLYRGMHHPTDVTAAFVNGLACVTIASTFVLGRRGWGEERDPHPAPTPAVVGASTRTDSR